MKKKDIGKLDDESDESDKNEALREAIEDGEGIPASRLSEDFHLDDKGNKKRIKDFKKINDEFVSSGIPFSVVLKTSEDSYFKWKDFNFCFYVSTHLWEKISSYPKWKKEIRGNKIELDIEKHGPKIEVSVLTPGGEEGLWDKQKKIISSVLVSFFKDNPIIDFFQNCMTVDFSELPDVKAVQNYCDKEKRMYELAIEGLETDKCFKVLLMGNTGTGKTFFSKIATKLLLTKKKVDCGVWGTLDCVADILAMNENMDLGLRFIFVVDELDISGKSRTQVSETAFVLKFFDNMENINAKLIGISNIPDLMDKAIFRPERIDMLIFSSHTKMSEESILKILKSLNKKDSGIGDEELVSLASHLAKKYKDTQLPTSFYSLGLRLFIIYKKNIDKMSKILDVFFEHKELYNFKNDDYNANKKMGFLNEDEE